MIHIEYENLNKVNYEFSKEFFIETKKLFKNGKFILGKNISIFENKFAKWNKSEYCVSVANGLDALFLAIKSLSLPKGSEIIVPANTYIASILAIINNGFKPVLVEPDINTYNIDPYKIEQKITSNTRAIMAVHLYGKPCSMDLITNICKKYNLLLVEDCAQAHGAKYKGRKVGTFGIVNAFSFYPTKNFGAIGDAGAITTNSIWHAHTVACLRNYGSFIKYTNVLPGVNSRMDEIQAIFLNIKLLHINKISKHKRDLAQLYFKNLKREFILPEINKDQYDVFHIFNVRHPKRDQLKKYLLKNGIGSEIHYPIPPHKQLALIGQKLPKKLPITEEIHKTTLSLPISYCHTHNDIYKVIEVLNKF